ncbi:ribonuclease H2 non-catalytic subunit-domain-containing protein [Tuber borchii]|uniref:Ribonuclease H2 non-catalytic subunit-domain-containing protein n=1 Tax=Tuber borchii TaxID=42251 RepID=A0A2T6ZDF6_TUBBO|nr:ribonuclease H2 non-catalytic subunit-domain-containing protein [Tuber borchii]
MNAGEVDGFYFRSFTLGWGCANWGCGIGLGSIGTKVAHFRGRKLVGKGVSLPEGYSGHVLTVTDEVPTGAIEKSKRNRPVVEEEDGEEGKGEVKIFKGLANFSDVVVWGHDIAPEEGREYVVKGMDEWIGLASKIHNFEDESEE